MALGINSTLLGETGFRCILIQRLKRCFEAPFYFHFLALFSTVIACWAASGTCHFTSGNFSEKSKSLSPCYPNKSLIKSHCFWPGHRPSSEPIAVAERMWCSGGQTAWVTCLHWEQCMESQGWGLSTSGEAARRAKTPTTKISVASLYRVIGRSEMCVSGM